MQVDVNIREATCRAFGAGPCGDDVVIIEAGKPLVRLTRVAGAPAPRKLGSAKGDFVVPYDFDDPLRDRVLDEFEA